MKLLKAIKKALSGKPTPGRCLECGLSYETDPVHMTPDALHCYWHNGTQDRPQDQSRVPFPKTDDWRSH